MQRLGVRWVGAYSWWPCFLLAEGMLSDSIFRAMLVLVVHITRGQLYPKSWCRVCVEVVCVFGDGFSIAANDVSCLQPVLSCCFLVLLMSWDC